MELGIVAGIAIFLNFMILKFKFTNGRVADGVLDAVVFAAIIFLTSNSGQMGMVAGMIGSALFSLYLLWSPFNLDGILGDGPIKG